MPRQKQRKQRKATRCWQPHGTRARRDPCRPFAYAVRVAFANAMHHNCQRDASWDHGKSSCDTSAKAKGVRTVERQSGSRRVSAGAPRRRCDVDARPSETVRGIEIEKQTATRGRRIEGTKHGGEARPPRPTVTGPGAWYVAVGVGYLRRWKRRVGSTVVNRLTTTVRAP